VEIPFAIRRLSYLGYGLRVDRDHPRLDHLASLEDSEEFCWRILPHAARSFAVSITLLPERIARTAAVGYLYARMLDSYEDLQPDRKQGRQALLRFGERLDHEPPDPVPTLAANLARDRRDRIHALLVQRCHLVDDLYRKLDAEDRSEICGLIKRMSQGMAWASLRFEAQAGVLDSEDEVRRYCHAVIGEPALFVLRLVAGRRLDHQEEKEALEVSELIQLANVTRDIERDLARGVAYHRSLRPFLGSAGAPGAREAIKTARIELTLMALERVHAYRRLSDTIRLPAFSFPRSASVAMLSFTEQHYRHQAILAGAETPKGRRRGRPVMRALPATFSRRWTERSLAGLERDLHATAASLRALEAVSPGNR